MDFQLKNLWWFDFARFTAKILLSVWAAMTTTTANVNYSLLFLFFVGYVSLIVCSNFWQFDCQKFYCRTRPTCESRNEKWLLSKWIVSYEFEWIVLANWDKTFERKSHDYINGRNESFNIILLVLIQNMHRSSLTSRSRITSRTRRLCVYSRKFIYMRLLCRCSTDNMARREHTSARIIRVRRSAHIVSHTCVSVNVLAPSAFPKSNFVPMESSTENSISHVLYGEPCTLVWYSLFGFIVHKADRPTEYVAQYCHHGARLRSSFFTTFIPSLLRMHIEAIQ